MFAAMSCIERTRVTAPAARRRAASGSAASPATDSAIGGGVLRREVRGGVPGHLPQGRVVRDGDRDAEAHGLDERAGRALPQRGQDERVPGGEERGNVPADAGQGDVVRNAADGREVAELGLERSGPRHDQVGCRVAFAGSAGMASIRYRRPFCGASRPTASSRGAAPSGHAGASSGSLAAASSSSKRNPRRTTATRSSGTPR